MRSISQTRPLQLFSQGEIERYCETFFQQPGSHFFWDDVCCLFMFMELYTHALIISIFLFILRYLHVKHFLSVKLFEEFPLCLPIFIPSNGFYLFRIIMLFSRDDPKIRNISYNGHWIFSRQWILWPSMAFVISFSNRLNSLSTTPRKMEKLSLFIPSIES